MYIELFVIVTAHSILWCSALGKFTVLHLYHGLMCEIWFQMDSGHGDLGTLANVVTSLASLSDSLRENLNNGDTSDSQHEEQSANDITRSECSS